MQPAPTETSPRLPNSVNGAHPETEAQHGILSPEVSANADPGSRDQRDAVGMQKQLAGLSLEDERRKRISEYENALSPSPPRKLSEGPGFKVVKKKGATRGDGPQLDEFPNGMPLSRPGTRRAVLIESRGPNTYPIPSSRCFSFCYLFSLKTILQSSHNSPCLAHCLLALLSRPRCPRQHQLQRRRSRTASLRTTRLHPSNRPCILAQRIHPPNTSTSKSRPW